MPALSVLAGPRALSLVRERGLRLADIDALIAASGGPKWLSLAGLDRVLFPWLLRRVKPLHVIGSSIGAWRLSCLAQPNPLSAIERFERAYIEQHYEPDPTPADVSRVSAAVLVALLGGNERAIVEHPIVRLHVLTNRCRGPLASDRKPLLLLGLGLAAGLNAISRRTLSWTMDRVVFDAAGDDSPFRGFTDLPTVHAVLTPDNVGPVLLASGSIPGVLTGVRIPGGPPGVHRDGGVIDYHPDLGVRDGPGVLLYPHFFPTVTPGWFDKSLGWRRARNLDRALVLAPSPELVATFPGGKIPDRTDFYRLSEPERIKAWRGVVSASARMGNELGELIASGRWAERVSPLPAR